MRTLRLIALVLALSPGCRAPGLFSRQDGLDAPPSEIAGTPNDRSADDASLLRPSPAEPGGDLLVAENRDVSGMPSGMDARRPEPSIQSLPVSELLARGERAVNEQKLREARLHLEGIIRKQPAHPRAHHLLGVVSDLEGRFGDAEHHYQAALQAEPNNAAIIGDLGYSYLLQGRHDLAEQYLLQARALDPSHLNAAQNLALLASRRGDYNGARATLSQILPPADVERRLAQLFPGGPASEPPRGIQETPGPLDSGVPPGYAMAPHGIGPQGAAGTPGDPRQVPLSGDASVNERLAAIDRASFVSNGAPIVVGPPAHPSPIVALPSAATSRNADDRTLSATDSAQAGGGVQSAVGFRPDVGAFTGAGPAPAGPAALPSRRWPPATWPPTEAGSTIRPASAEVENGSESPPTADAAGGGVMYLMPNRPRAVPPSGSPIPPAGQSPAPQTSASPTDSVQYNTGPGNSRTVIWNGPPQSRTTSEAGASFSAADQPGDADARRTAATMGLNAGSHQPYPLVERTSPGTSSHVGSEYPAPGRQLPGMSIPAGLPAGSNTSPSLPPPAVTSRTPSLPYIEFASPAPPAANLQPYVDERARYDRQFNAQVENSYGQSPSNYIPSPSSATPAPVYEVPPYRPQSAAPVNPETGTPWPGRPAQTAYSGVAGSGSSQPAAPGQSPNSAGIVMPPPYSPMQRVATPAAAEHYPNRPAADPYQGPIIRPGPW